MLEEFKFENPSVHMRSDDLCQCVQN